MKPFNLRTEFWLVINSLLISLLLLPAAVYIVGSTLFSPNTSGISGFYHDFLRGLAQGQLPALILVLGPTCTLLLIRGILRFQRPKKQNTK